MEKLIKSADDKPVTVKIEKRTDDGTIIAVFKDARRAFTFEDESYGRLIRAALHDLGVGTSQDVGITADGRLVRLISSTPRAKGEGLSFVVGGGEKDAQKPRNVLTILREDAKAFAGMLAAAAIPAAKLVAERTMPAGWPMESPAARLLAESFPDEELDGHPELDWDDKSVLLDDGADWSYPVTREEIYEEIDRGQVAELLARPQCQSCGHPIMLPLIDA